MFCSNCGKSMDETALFCQHCGAKVNDNTKAVNSEEEKVVKEGLCNRVKNILYVQNGHGMLTTKRFIYAKHSLASIAVMGVLVNLTKGSYDFEILLSDIVEMRQGRQGVSKTVILKTKDGSEYNFYFNNREEWETEFQKLLKK